jgi:hypothetical protein
MFYLSWNPPSCCSKSYPPIRFPSVSFRWWPDPPSVRRIRHQNRSHLSQDQHLRSSHILKPEKIKEKAPRHVKTGNNVWRSQILSSTKSHISNNTVTNYLHVIWVKQKKLLERAAEGTFVGRRRVTCGVGWRRTAELRRGGTKDQEVRERPLHPSGPTCCKRRTHVLKVVIYSRYNCNEDILFFFWSLYKLSNKVNLILLLLTQRALSHNLDKQFCQWSVLSYVKYFIRIPTDQYFFAAETVVKSERMKFEYDLALTNWYL